MTNSEGIALERSEIKDRLLKWSVLYVASILAALIVGHYPIFKNEISLGFPWSLERIVYLVTFSGTFLGALGATQPKDAPVESRVRDLLSLLGWSVLTVAALLSFFVADGPMS